MKSDSILILTLQRIVALYHIKQNSEAARGSTNCVCLLVRRLTINNYSSDVIRMWPEADNYHNLITRSRWRSRSHGSGPLLLPWSSPIMCHLDRANNIRVITHRAREGCGDSDFTLFSFFVDMKKSHVEIKMIYWSWQISLELWLQVSFVMTHFNLMDNARRGILAEFCFF